MKEADKLLEGPDEMYDALVDYGFDKHEASVAAACKDIIEFRLTELLLSTRDPFPRDWSDLEDFAESCRRLEIRGLPEKPVAPTIVAAHLRRLILEGRSHEDVLRAAATIDAAHDIHGFSPPSGHSYVKTVLAFNRQRTPTHGDEETASPVAADLQTALDALESKLPHLAHLGSDGRTKVYDLIRRAKVLLNPKSQ